MTKYEPKTTNELRQTAWNRPEVLDDLAHCEACLAERDAEVERWKIADEYMTARIKIDDAAYEELEAEVERLKWQPIETAPKDGTAVLTYRGTGLIAVAEWFQEINGWCVTDGCGIVNVTHWMPLPKEPNQ